MFDLSDPRAVRLFCLLAALLFALLPCFASSEEVLSEEQLEESIYPNIYVEIRPDSVYAPGLEGVASWYSDAPETARGQGNEILSFNEGFASLTAVLENGTEVYYDVVVTEDAVPGPIRDAVALALSEWETYLGKTFTQRNKYTAWYCGTGPKCYFGWCGGFASYCLDTAGVPMDEPNDSVPHETGEPYAVHAAGVGKLYKGFTNMERITNIPKPGYLVIYGKRDYYNFMHVGMITDAEPLGDGKYIVRTVEGNMSSRIKRYCYLYDANDTTEHNYSEAPEEYQTDKDTFQYTIHQKKWFVYAICQTWF